MDRSLGPVSLTHMTAFSGIKVGFLHEVCRQRASSLPVSFRGISFAFRVNPCPARSILSHAGPGII